MPKYNYIQPPIPISSDLLDNSRSAKSSLSDDMMRIKVSADRVNSWSLSVTDIDTGKILPVESITINSANGVDEYITANVTIIIEELDLKEIQLSKLSAISIVRVPGE